MKRATRRQFLETSAIASVGMGSWLALGKPPAYAQKRELTFLSWNHFVPASDDELRKQAEAFSKQAGVSVRVDTIAHLQLMAKFAAEAQSQSGHDMIRTHDAIPFLFESQLADVGDVVDKLGKQPAINSGKTAQVIEWWKELFRDAMEPEVLSWDDASNNRFILSGKGSWIHNPISPYNAALKEKMPIADDINHHTSPAGPAGIHSAVPILGLGVWKFSKNIDVAKEFIQFLFRKENYYAWIVASNAFNHPPLRHFADHPIWARNPKFAMLPKEAEYAHPRGWPAKPSDAAQRIDEAFVLPDMTAKAVNGMPTKRAMDWAQDQVARAIKGQLKVG